MEQSLLLPLWFYLAFILPGFTLAQSTLTADQQRCKPCEELLELELPDVAILEASAGDEPVAHCRVLGRISKEINFELLLPHQWNGRFAMGGGGGFVGSIQNSARWSVGQGYATSGTDTGHQGPGLKGDWALHNMERQINFGRLAIHRTAVVSKAIITDYYCSYPLKSFFMGCSRGGGQGMIEAQLYPEDFDGILAAAPVLDWPATAAEFIQNVKILFPDPGNLESIISPEEIAIFQASVYDQCDALDGVEDYILNDPRDCEFDFSKLPACADEQDAETCFTRVEVDACKKILGGASNKNGQIYPGFPVGCEGEPGAWKEWITGPNAGSMELGYPSLHYAYGIEFFKYLVFQDPEWDFRAYDFDNFEKDTRYAASYLNATSTDYSDFKERGGKLLVYHGWNDHALSAYTMIDHYKAVKKLNPDVEEFMRLYLLPGVLHCAGGTGPSEADWLEILRVWVEDDTAPERVVVSKKLDDDRTMTRPVFPYPKKAVYDGKGDPNEQVSFHSN